MRGRLQALIVLLIIGMGASICIVWIKKVRDANAMTQDINNLKQLALSIHSFHDVYRVFPPATHWSSDRWFPAGKKRNNLAVEERVSWIFIISPFIESRMDPDWKIDPMKSWKSPENRYVREGYMPVALCPLEQQENVTDYVGIAGAGADAPTLPLGDPRIGFFGFDRLITKTDIKDGMSNTIGIAETHRDVGPWIAGGFTTARGLDPDQPPYIGEGGQFHSPHRISRSWSSEMQINAAFVDGSVRSLNQSLDPKIWEAMATIAGEEKVEITD
jgi:hypothetical protein